MATMKLNWDIFCRVIDNYGDIGVCWRLARQLANEYDFTVRLWVDDLAALALLCPELDMAKATQELQEVQVQLWGTSFPDVNAADVVIEAFACDLPESYLKAMARRPAPPCWVNLEYLSAESWVEGCHRMASPHPTLPLTKHFFFPGFTTGTGGLIREAGLLQRRDHFLAAPPQGGPLQISLFCYDTAPVRQILDIWAKAGKPVRCLVPPGKPMAAVIAHLGPGTAWRRGNLEVLAVPFLAQSQFDHLLWQSDINFVRGEDSFVRAQWAGKPFIWHIYPQDDGAHLTKLDAFLALYLAGLPPDSANAVTALFHAWNLGQDLTGPWNAFLAHRDLLARHGRQWADTLSCRDHLAASLVKFCTLKV